MSAKPKRATRSKKSGEPTLTAAQRLYLKEAEADLRSCVWHQRTSDLKKFIRLLKIEPAPEDDVIDTKDSAARAFATFLMSLEEGDDEVEGEDEDASASGSASGSAGAAGGETQALPAASQVPMAPVVHALKLQKTEKKKKN
jgi:hypothetical protein